MGVGSRLSLAGVWLLIAGAAWAADPPLPVEVLPPPHVIEAPPVVTAPPIYGSFRANRWDVWQYYEVDRRGYFRPVVVPSPYGFAYRYNGEPFPWASMHQLEYAPRVMGTPYSSYMPYIVD